MVVQCAVRVHQALAFATSLRRQAVLARRRPMVLTLSQRLAVLEKHARWVQIFRRPCLRPQT